MRWDNFEEVALVEKKIACQTRTVPTYSPDDTQPMPAPSIRPEPVSIPDEVPESLTEIWLEETDIQEDVQ